MISRDRYLPQAIVNKGLHSVAVRVEEAPRPEPREPQSTTPVAVQRSSSAEPEVSEAPVASAAPEPEMQEPSEESPAEIPEIQLPGCDA